MKTNKLLIVQLLGTVLTIAFVPNNYLKWIVLWALWILTFKSFTRKEVVFLVFINIFFTIMNALSLKQGIFSFSHPDSLGMPVYELTMWGFYLLHTSRVLKGPVPKKNDKVIYLLAFVYSACFGSIPNQNILFMVLIALMGICFILYHDKYDFLYVGYMIALGAVIEYTGVLSSEWMYPEKSVILIPFWFTTLWGGVGFFLRRLGEPLFRD
jgi:hypothetical protein